MISLNLANDLFFANFVACLAHSRTPLACCFLISRCIFRVVLSLLSTALWKWLRGARTDSCLRCSSLLVDSSRFTDRGRDIPLYYSSEQWPCLFLRLHCLLHTPPCVTPLRCWVGDIYTMAFITNDLIYSVHFTWLPFHHPLISSIHKES